MFIIRRLSWSGGGGGCKNNSSTDERCPPRGTTPPPCSPVPPRSDTPAGPWLSSKGNRKKRNSSKLNNKTVVKGNSRQLK